MLNWVEIRMYQTVDFATPNIVAISRMGFFCFRSLRMACFTCMESSAHMPATRSSDLSHYSVPEKLHPEDLDRSDSSLQDQEDIPEQLESDLSGPSGGCVHDIGVTADVPVAAPSVLDPFSSKEKDNSAKDLDRNEETDPPEYKEGSIRDQSEKQGNADHQAEVIVHGVTS
ncbi:unnamed protein product [Ranitomeya imitator]|uniref:Uncharacterized protein n=1 Tax=Ranitomeya imitator TaxID=111125 RepID=A0ABN9LEH0_9NEOB|nr:unnamed protein product [Ranitomeya imitator]